MTDFNNFDKVITVSHIKQEGYDMKVSRVVKGEKYSEVVAGDVVEIDGHYGIVIRNGAGPDKFNIALFEGDTRYVNGVSLEELREELRISEAEILLCKDFKIEIVERNAII